MNKKLFLLPIVSLFALSFAAAPTVTPKLPKISDGCYQVSTTEELYGFAAAMNGSDGFTKDTTNRCMNLNADIVVNKNVLDKDFELAGDTASYITWKPILSFNGGEIYGNGHKISGLVVLSVGNNSHLGFINFAANGLLVKNFHIEDSYYRDTTRYGYVDFMGGFVADAPNGASIYGSSFSGNIISEYFSINMVCGGLVGQGTANIENSCVAGSIKCPGTTGGFVGERYYDVSIKKSYNEATVFAAKELGGFVGGATLNREVLKFGNPTTSEKLWLLLMMRKQVALSVPQIRAIFTFSIRTTPVRFPLPLRLSAILRL